MAKVMAAEIANVMREKFKEIRADIQRRDDLINARLADLERKP